MIICLVVFFFYFKTLTPNTRPEIGYQSFQHFCRVTAEIVFFISDYFFYAEGKSCSGTNQEMANYFLFFSLLKLFYCGFYGCY